MTEDSRGEIDLNFLGCMLAQGLDEQREIRRALREIRHRVLLNTDMTRRVERRAGEVERRIDELKDDLEPMIKAEIGGRLAHIETENEPRVERMLEEFAVRSGHRDTP